MKEGAEMKPTEEDRNAGLKAKYRISHADGTPCDEGAEYFVLRLDHHEGCDHAHVTACRAAARCYACLVRSHLPTLSKELLERCGGDEKSEKEGTEEGDVCGRDGCDGVMDWKPAENCSCHVSPPCSACVDAPLWCPECGFEVER